MSRGNVQLSQLVDFSAQYKLLYESLGLEQEGPTSSALNKSLWDDSAVNPERVRVADAIRALTLLERPALLAQLKTHLPADTITVKPEDFVDASLDDLQRQFDSLTALVNHLGETARAEQSFAMALLGYPELLRQLDYWLGEIARAHPGFVEALFGRLDVLESFYPYQKYIILFEAESRFSVQSLSSDELITLVFQDMRGSHMKRIPFKHVEFALALLERDMFGPADYESGSREYTEVCERLVDRHPEFAEALLAHPDYLMGIYRGELSKFFKKYPRLVGVLLERPDLQQGFSQAQQFQLAKVDARLAIALLDAPEWLTESFDLAGVEECAQKFPEFARKALRHSGFHQITFKPIVQDHLINMGLTWLPAVLDAIDKLYSTSHTDESLEGIEQALCMALADFPILSDEGGPKPGMADFLNYCPEGGMSIAAAIRAAEQKRGMTPGGKGSFFAQNAEGGPPVPGITFST